MNPEVAGLPKAFRERANDLFGFVPTTIDELAHSPAVANAYLSALEAVGEGVLTDGERNVIMLAVSAANDSMYCVEVHRALAREEDVETHDLNLITMQQLPKDMRLRALVQTTWRLLDRRGRLDANDLEGFGSYGIERRQIYEIIAIIRPYRTTSSTSEASETAVEMERRDDDDSCKRITRTSCNRLEKYHDSNE